GTAGDSSVSFSWNQPAFTSGLSGFRIVTNPGSVNTDLTLASLGGSASSYHYTLTGLTNGTLYTFNLFALYGGNGPGLAAANTLQMSPTSTSLLQHIDVTRPQGDLVITQVCSGLPLDVNGNFDPTGANGNVNAKTVSDAVTNGTTTVTSATANFIAGDLHK